MDKEHILFVNISENQIYNFAKVFVEKCDEKKLPYDFKFALVEQRDDGFQIYTNVLYVMTQYIFRAFSWFYKYSRRNKREISNAN